MEKLKIKEAIVVEGRDDTAVLRRVTDALIIETHGFGIKKETWEILEKAYNEKGLIILTDPDFAGEKIRSKLKEKFPESKHSYMPRRKAVKNGDIGVENAEPADVAESLMKVCTPVLAEEAGEFTLQDMDRTGLSGKADSKVKRQKVGEVLGIGYGNCSAFVKKLNSFGISRKQFEEAIESVLLRGK
ncbi:MAG: ribonuclease M5 [Anaerovoracaceae bacterium]|nr:ribonuclease M5 [Bacillota bacterium]MEE0517679.1 ribonuclease M5 [Anaerovoracaceae bacterium]